MNERHRSASPENPFCTRRVRPGGVPYLFGPGQTVATLVQRLRHGGWWGQIVGPHGSGKSALLAALVPAVEQAGRQPRVIELHDRQRRPPWDLVRAGGPDDSVQLIVDGYEQLSRWNRFRVKRFCRRHGAGLLVTAHVPVGLPELCQTAPDLELARQIVDQLQRGYPAHVTPDDVAECFSRHGENLRETLFDLYDLYERRSRA